MAKFGKSAVLIVIFLILYLFPLKLQAEEKTHTATRPGAEDIGIKIGTYEHGKYNAITDVNGVLVGQVRLNYGSGKLKPGKGPVRTGVTAILPHSGNIWNEKVAAGAFVLNGCGEVTGLTWLLESGILETPIILTNTLSVGIADNAVISWMLTKNPDIGINDDTVTPVVAECDDSTLNDIQGRHVKEEDVFTALDNAKSGPVEEGCVGAGTGMICYEFKGGIGTSSRILPASSGGYTVGVLVLSNFGERKELMINGVPAGKEIADLMPVAHSDGSIIAVVATDAPLTSRQLSRLAKRSALGMAKTGSNSHNGSGDVIIAFSTAVRIPHKPKEPVLSIKMLSDFYLDPLFEAASDATEEAIINALLKAETTEGRDGNIVYAIPIDRLKAIMKKYGR